MMRTKTIRATMMNTLATLCSSGLWLFAAAALGLWGTSIVHKINASLNFT